MYIYIVRNQRDTVVYALTKALLTAYIWTVTTAKEIFKPLLVNYCLREKLLHYALLILFLSNERIVILHRIVLYPASRHIYFKVIKFHRISEREYHRLHERVMLH